jgi:hypothetical protein
MSQETQTESGKEKPGEPFRIVIDDETYETLAHELSVRAILELAGVDPTTHVLVQIRGREQQRHEDLDETIKINSGLKFVTVSREPVPVA